MQGFYDGKPEGFSVNRRTKYKKEFKQDPKLPDTGKHEDLALAFLEAGLVSTLDSGAEIPLRWTEIDAYSRTCKTISHSWEHQTLRKMSMAYLSGKHIGNDVFGIHPVEIRNNKETNPDG